MNSVKLVYLPSMDGFQVIHQLRSQGVTTQVFILSSRQADNDKVFTMGLGVDDNTIMVHIRRLRTKTEDDPNHPQYLRTVRGVGYQFCPEAD